MTCNHCKSHVEKALFIGWCFCKVNLKKKMPWLIWSDVDDDILAKAVSEYDTRWFQYQRKRFVWLKEAENAGG